MSSAASSNDNKPQTDSRDVLNFLESLENLTSANTTTTNAKPPSTVDSSQTTNAQSVLDFLDQLSKPESSSEPVSAPAQIAVNSQPATIQHQAADIKQVPQQQTSEPTNNQSSIGAASQKTSSLTKEKIEEQNGWSGLTAFGGIWNSVKAVTNNENVKGLAKSLHLEDLGTLTSSITTNIIDTIAPPISPTSSTFPKGSGSSLTVHFATPNIAIPDFERDIYDAISLVSKKKKKEMEVDVRTNLSSSAVVNVPVMSTVEEAMIQAKALHSKLETDYGNEPASVAKVNLFLTVFPFYIAAEPVKLLQFYSIVSSKSSPLLETTAEASKSLVNSVRLHTFSQSIIVDEGLPAGAEWKRQVVRSSVKYLLDSWMTKVSPAK
ncbi:hypothetical protein BKA69DRAFT_1047641 [Paraphysoderma sedebokerense]|nr:hypothetical protein BKA69DRAFT_1047641 [Paraphysoderma sedebokerense]